MHILKPLWLKHGVEDKTSEVYGCHVSPDGQRLATAAGDTYVRIWSTEAIYKAQDSTYANPRQLSSLSYHSGTIHSVRFSGNGKYLASGADDRIVCVYMLESGPPTQPVFGNALPRSGDASKVADDVALGSNEAPPVENWRMIRRLTGHDNDVVDLGWSHDSSILVSVGLDCKVVVWSGFTFEKLKTLSNHGSQVKGITFDPANKYFATASDDRTIKVFRYTPPLPNSTASDNTQNFMLETTITAPFVASPLTTYFRRCSWSPDGNHIGAANAVNSNVATVAIVNRGSWDSDINLVGHDAPTEVCCFSPRIFSKTPVDPKDDPSKLSGVTVIALGGQDHAVTVWNTMNSKPLSINEGLCGKSVSDLAWSPDGERLFFTSLDGTIGVAIFKEGELGYPVPLEVNENSLARYGAGRKVGVAQGTQGMHLEELSKSDELKGVQGRMGELMGDLPSAGGLTNGVKPAVTDDVTPAIKSTPETSNVATNGVTNGAATKEAETTTTAPDPNAEKIEKLKSRVTITKDGKKRVAPLLISSLAGQTESSLPRSQLMSSVHTTARADAPQAVLDLSKPYDGLPKGGLASLIFGNKRKYAESGLEDDNRISQTVSMVANQGATAILANTAEGLDTASVTNVPNDQRVEPLDLSLMVSQLRLATPAPRTYISRPLNGSMTSSDTDPNATGPDGVKANDTVRTNPLANSTSPVMEIHNPSGVPRTGRVQERDPARIVVTRKGQLIWQDFLTRPVCLVTGNSRFWAAACEDGALFVWSPAGRRMFNCLMMEAQPAILDCRGPWLLCISAVGLCRVWNIVEATSPHPPVHLAPILRPAALSMDHQLTGAPSVIFARLTSEGRVIVALSNGEAYTYSVAMYCWQRLSEPWWAVGSQYWNTSDNSSNTSLHKGQTADAEKDDAVKQENFAAGVIPLLERNTTDQVLLRGRAYVLQRLFKALLSAEGFEGFETAVSVAHLENRVAAAYSLHAKNEFKTYLVAYVKRLGAEGARLKIEELLRNLNRNTFPTGEEQGQRSSEVSKEVCGWPKEALLREIIIILGKHRDLQRITMPYARMLGIVDTFVEDDDMSG